MKGEEGMYTCMCIYMYILIKSTYSILVGHVHKVFSQPLT